MATTKRPTTKRKATSKASKRLTRIVASDKQAREQAPGIAALLRSMPVNDFDQGRANATPIVFD